MASPNRPRQSATPAVPACSCCLKAKRNRARRTCELTALGNQAGFCDALRQWDYSAYTGILTIDVHSTIPDWTAFIHGCPSDEYRGLGATALEGTSGRRWRSDQPPQGVTTKHGVCESPHGRTLPSLAGCRLGPRAAGGALLTLGTAWWARWAISGSNRRLCAGMPPVQPLA